MFRWNQFGSIELSKNGNATGDLPTDSNNESGENNNGGNDGDKPKPQPQTNTFPIWLLVLAILGYFVLKKK